eukprot:3205394-Prymnesium_polylepis.5
MQGAVCRAEGVVSGIESGGRTCAAVRHHLVEEAKVVEPREEFAHGPLAALAIVGHPLEGDCSHWDRDVSLDSVRNPKRVGMRVAAVALLLLLGSKASGLL